MQFDNEKAMRSYFIRYKSHYKDTVRLGIPIVLGQLGIVAVGIFDNIMIGRYGTPDLAAASFVNSVFNIPILFGLGFSYGLTPLVGQFFGRGEKLSVGGLLKNSLLANAIIAVILMLVMSLFYFRVDRMGQPEELLPLIRPYFLLQLSSLLFVMLFNSFKQFADGITDTATPMWIMLSANVLNIIGNSILIYGYFGIPALGLTGAGISTLVSRIYMCGVFAILFFRKPKFRRYLVGFKRISLNRSDLLLLNRMGIMVGLQMGMETALFSITGVMIGWLGTIALAAHQVVVSISTLGFMIYYGVGAAVSVRVSNFYGRRDIGNVKEASRAGLHLIMVLALIISLFFLISRRYLGFVFTSSEEVAQWVSSLMIILLFYQFGDALQITYANSLRGIGDVNSMALISFIGYFLIALPFSYFLGIKAGYGIFGIWWGYPVGLTLTGLMLMIRYHYVLKRKYRLIKG